MFRNTQHHMLRHPTSIALNAVVNLVTADGCVHITESVGSRRELLANSCTHRRNSFVASALAVCIGLKLLVLVVGVQL